MLRLEGNIIVYHDGVPYGEILYDEGEITLRTTENPLSHSEILDLIDILKSIESKM